MSSYRKIADGQELSILVHRQQSSFYCLSLTEVSAVTILEFLTTTAWTWVVWSWHLIFDIRRSVHLLCTFSRVLSRCSCLIWIGEIFFLLIVALTPLFWSSLLHFFVLHFRNLRTHQDAGCLVIHLVNHAVPKFRTLQFEDKQRVFLFVRSILHTVPQVV